MLQRLILVSTSIVDRIFAEHVAGHLGIELQTFAKIEAAGPSLTKSDHIIFDSSDSEEVVSFEQVTKDFNSSQLHVISASPEKLCSTAEIIASRRFATWITRPAASDQKDTEANSQFYALLLKSIDQNKPAFHEQEVGHETLTLEASIQKEMVVHAFMTNCQNNGCSSRVADTVASAVDEMIMNAMYHAPRGGKSGRFTPDQFRDEVEMDPEKLIQVEMSFLKPFVHAAVTDRYGCLSRDIFLNRVSRSYNGFNQNSLASPEVTPGIGLAMVFRSGGNFFIDVEQDRRTTVHVFFEMTGQSRKAQNGYRFIAAHCR